MSILSDSVALTRKLITFDTTNPPGNEGDCAVFVGALLEEAGFRTTFHEFAHQRTTIVARLGDDASRQLLCLTGHLDTVPLGAAAWQTPAFDGEIAGNRIYGRGASDMKAGVAAMILAAQNVASAAKGRANILLISKWCDR